MVKECGPHALNWYSRAANVEGSHRTDDTRHRYDVWLWTKRVTSGRKDARRRRNRDLDRQKCSRPVATDHQALDDIVYLIRERRIRGTVATTSGSLTSRVVDHVLKR